MKSGEGESFAFGYFYFISKVKLELGFVQILLKTENSEGRI